MYIVSFKNQILPISNMWYLSLSDIVHLVWSSLGPSCYCKWHYFVLFMANIPSYIYIHTQTPHICFTHSSVDGHLGCFHVLAIVNSAAINTGVHQIRSDQSLSRVRLFATPWITARQASLSITNFRSSLRLTSIESVMPSSHLILSLILMLYFYDFPAIKYRYVNVVIESCESC